MKKSYHSMVVPIRLAKATLRGTWSDGPAVGPGSCTAATGLGQYQRALVFAARKGVGKTLVHVRTAALDPLVFPGTVGFCVRVLLEVRALLPSQVNLATRIVISAGSGTLPAL